MGKTAFAGVALGVMSPRAASSRKQRLMEERLRLQNALLAARDAEIAAAKLSCLHEDEPACEDDRQDDAPPAEILWLYHRPNHGIGKCGD